MSLYERLNLIHPKRQKKVPLSERLNLTRPPKLRCLSCGKKIQPEWEFCTKCGQPLLLNKTETKHYIWIDISGIIVKPEYKEAISSILMDAFSQVYGAFRSINIFLTSDRPDPKKCEDDYTHIYIFADDQPVDYLGIASFQLGEVTNKAIIRIDQVFLASHYAQLEKNQLSNLIANTIAHEIGHTLGLDHSNLKSDVMHDGLDYGIHGLIPPSFHGTQIQAMNKAIYFHKEENWLPKRKDI